MDGVQPFALLDEVALEETVHRADDSLNRQRHGLDSRPGKDSEETRDSTVVSGPVRATLSQTMSLGSKQAEKLKGLVSHKEGWYYVCEFDYCQSDWSTSIVCMEQVPALVEMYKLHVHQCHGKKESSAEQEKFDKDHASYTEATKLRSIEAHKDNRVDVLSPVRFYPKPLRHKYIAELQPANQTPVWDRIDLSHLGIQLADTTIIKKIHNRAHATAELHDFSNLNLGLNEADKDVKLRPDKQGGMKQTKGSKALSSISEAVMALMNCSTIWSHIHPCDYGTEVIVRFLLSKIHHPTSEKTLTVRGICKFFKAAFKGNADRVLGPEGPRTYQEIVTLFNSMDWSNQEAVFGTNEEFRRNHLKRTHSESSRTGGKNPRVNWCFAFNTTGGCKRSSGDTCKKDGRVLKHSCSFVDADGKMCGAKDHGEAGHEQ